MAQRGRPKKNISEVKALIEDIKPAAVASECVNTQITTVTQAKNPLTYNKVEIFKDGVLEISPNDPRYEGLKALGDHYDAIASKDWRLQVEKYCSSEAITPIELIEQHKSFKKALNSRKTSENKVEVRDLNAEALPKGGLTKYDQERRFKKLGF